MFAALGRFTVRFRWLIIAAWIVATVVLVTVPPLASPVSRRAATPSSCPPSTERAGGAAGRPVPPPRTPRTPPWSPPPPADLSPPPTTPPSTGPSRPCGRCPGSSPWSTRECRPTVGPDRPWSSCELPPGSSDGRRPRTVVDRPATTFATADPPPGLAMHLTGGLAAVRRPAEPERAHPEPDRAPVGAVHPGPALFHLPGPLAPFIALLPSAVALIAAGPIIAESTHLGVQVSDLTPVLLVVVLLGAGHRLRALPHLPASGRSSGGGGASTTRWPSRCARWASRSPSPASP